MNRKFYGLLLILPLAVMVNVVQVHHAGMVLSHFFGGRAGNCTLGESFEAESISRLQNANVEAIRRDSRVIQKDKQYSLWRTRDGDYWMPTASGVDSLMDLGEQERNIYGTRTSVHPGDIVLDGGANVGVFTRKALWAGAAKVIAIEPGPENVECLRRTFAEEIADGRVVVYPKGIWDKDDVLKLSVDPVASAKDSFVRAIENAQFIEAPLTTVDKMVVELGLQRVDFIKMDIEGAERRAIVGAHDTIAKYRPRMALCIYHIRDDEYMVPGLVLQTRPDYKVARTCLCVAHRIQPEVAFFF